jgi:hypothetical protein
MPLASNKVGQFFEKAPLDLMKLKLAVGIDQALVAAL